MRCQARPDRLALRPGTTGRDTDGGRMSPVGAIEWWPEAVVLDPDSTEQRVLCAAIDALNGCRGRG